MNRQVYFWSFAVVLAGCSSTANTGTAHAPDAGAGHPDANATHPDARATHADARATHEASAALDGGKAQPEAGALSPDTGVSVSTLKGLIVASDSIAEASPANLYVARPDGTGKCYVTNDGNWNRNAGWSYDGTKIVWDLRNSTGGIWVMDANGSNKQALTPLPSWAFGPAFSPDGNHIAYSDYPGGNPGSMPLVGIEVYVMNADGTNKVQLTTTTVNGTTATNTVIRWSNRPAYSPDGTKIVYASTQSGNSEIWDMNADGTSQRQLTFNTDPMAPDANFPSFSPDGTKIAFLCGFETLYGNICVMNADGSGRRPLTFNVQGPTTLDASSSDEPAWSPDGDFIMFDSNQYDPGLGGHAAETWFMSADGGKQQVLMSHMYGEGRNPWRNNPAKDGGSLFMCDASM
jgi:Tol biopolymer transport system component